MQKFEKYQLVSTISVVIKRQFPDLFLQISKLPDYRKRPQYEVKELIFSGLLMFLFKQKTRNAADNTSKNLDYQDNIKRIFGVRVADMDTVDLFLRKLEPVELELVKQAMFRELVKSKVLKKYKFADKFYMLAIDGTGLQSFDYEPYPGCPFKKYKSGKKVWTTYVLEAKIIGSNGFSLSLATEWVENPTDEKFDKQDCEFKALKRLSVKLKKNFPRLPLLLLLDGLYPKEPIFSICKNNNWSYIITLKDKSLKSVQEQISDQLLFKTYQTENNLTANSTHWLENDYKFFEGIEYKAHNLFVLETLFEKKHKKSNKIEKTRFVHVVDIEINKKNAHQISQAGRLRWKIENEGFNNQKNNDYNLTHKFSRTNFNATKNYYQLLQIADMINQLTYKSSSMSKRIEKYGLTIKSIIAEIFSYIKSYLFENEKLLEDILSLKTQLRY